MKNVFIKTHAEDVIDFLLTNVNEAIENERICVSNYADIDIILNNLI